MSDNLNKSFFDIISEHNQKSEPIANKNSNLHTQSDLSTDSNFTDDSVQVGKNIIQELVEIFYFYMDSLPEVKVIREQHQADLTEAKWKLTLFLTGWMGGPQEYVARFGHPRLRARHLPFKIGLSERDQWLLCMFKAIDDMVAAGKIPDTAIHPMAKQLKSSLAHLANHMRNQNENV